MKKLTLLLLLYSAALSSFAQKATLQNPQNALANPRTDKKLINGLTVVLQPAPGNSFLFSIYEKGKRLYSLSHHPVHQTPQGYGTRAAAFAAAGQLIGAYRQHRHFPNQIRPQDARRLGLLDQQLQ